MCIYVAPLLFGLFSIKEKKNSQDRINDLAKYKIPSFRALPPGVKFGPGWVGENDRTPPKPLFVPSSTLLSSLPRDSAPVAIPCNILVHAIRHGYEYFINS
uniref:Uncharacterized protein n=1 Tax=Vitis vinifera TaxID=29760 RepID=F6H7P4_VITVI